MALAFNRDFAPRTGEAVAVAPSVRRVTAPNPGPFTFHGTNTFLIGEDQVVVLDPGPDDPAHVAALVRAIGDAEVRSILLTHTHRDHSAGARSLQRRFGAPIGICDAASPSRAQQQSGEPSLLDADSDFDLVADMALRDGSIVSAGALRLELVATPGHAADHAAFALLGHDILFSGDHVMGWSTTVVAPPDGSMADYMASLERLLARPEWLYLPAHGAAIPDGHARVRALRDHRRMREAAILAALRRGDRAIPDIVARVYADLDPSLRGAAALSTLAHLADLRARGLVATDGPPTLDQSYRAVDAIPETAPGSG